MTHQHPTATIRSWASGRMSADVQRSIERIARADDVRHVAIMPDVHLGQGICIGTAFATSTLLYPDAVGGDIGCGMAAVALDAAPRRLSSHRLAALHRAITQAVPIHRHRRDEARNHADLLPDAAELSTPQLRLLAEKQGPIQLGTLGTGNHFLELQRDGEGRYWLMVHSGSRGMGQAIRSLHISHATQGRTGLRFLDAESAEGRAYLQDMHWARQFAATNRRTMLLAAGRAVGEILNSELQEESLFDCDHNHARLEEHFGERVYVHRKGAMPAEAKTHGIVPGSMAAPSFHVIGRGVAESLCSSAHGAGRAMSRSQARSRISRQKLLQELRDVYVDPRAAAGLREEAPSAYKDIHKIMKDQRELVRTRRTLVPIMTHKGSAK